MLILDGVVKESEVIKMLSQTIKASVLKFVNDEDGLTIVEYAVAGGLITAVVVTAFTLLGGAVDTRIRGLCNSIIPGTC
jgi:pilus assembly protein Flp/PilA